MKISRPRTFSSISIIVSPSLKQPTVALPMGRLRWLAMPFVSSRLALPLKIMISGTENYPCSFLVNKFEYAVHYIRCLSFCSMNTGVLGFEPRNAGIKTRCLTAWLHPNASSFKKRYFAFSHLECQHLCTEIRSSRSRRLRMLFFYFLTATDSSLSAVAQMDSCPFVKK